MLATIYFLPKLKLLKYTITECLNSHYTLCGLVVWTNTVKFCKRTHVRKHSAFPLQTKYHHLTCWTLTLQLLTVRCFSCGSTHSARVLPVGPRGNLDLRDASGMRGRPAGGGYSCGGCWNIRYWWTCVPNMVRRYRLCVEVAKSKHRTLRVSGPRRKTSTVRSRSGRV